MNPDSTISKVIKRPDKSAAGALAADLAKAKEQYESARASVVQRGAQRQQDLANLQAEIAAEQTEINVVLEQAKQG